MTRWFAVWAGVACTSNEPADVVYGPLDDVLRFDHVQALGTHNSYHGQQPLGRPEWDYVHQPLWRQAHELGVRQFELDLYWNDETATFDVLHVPVVDDASVCPTLRGCLWDLKVWSDSAPGHHPILAFFEVKDVVDDADVARERLDAIEELVVSVWPRERLITPDDVRGEWPSVSEALDADGWPTLGALRGRAVFVLHEGGLYRDVYTEGGADVPGGLLFQNARDDESAPYAAFVNVDDPDAAHIAALIDRGILVRTRADSDTVEARASDTTRRDRALATGATFVSTDFPSPHPDTGYVVQIPGGTPSRCNPRTAPPECTSEAVEDLSGSTAAARQRRRR